MRRSWGKGIGAAGGDDWWRQRKAATPAFTPSAVDGRIAQFALAAGKAEDVRPLGEQRNLPDVVARIIADIVFTVLVAVAKVFLLDTSGLEGLLRIASFLALGFSLIGIGWLYSRYIRNEIY